MIRLQNDLLRWTALDSLEARVHTFDHSIVGTIHPRAGTSVAHYLNNEDRRSQDQFFLPVTHAMIYSGGYHVPVELDEFQASPAFAAVPKERILWVVGGKASGGELPKHEPRRFAVCYVDHFLLGTMLVAPNLRSLDHFNGRVATKPFETLHEASLAPLRGDRVLMESEPVAYYECVTVNLRNVSSICEVG